MFHMPKAVTDGDSIVWFRRSDAIAAGDIYNSDIYPPIDVDKGGSINGEIDALNKLIDMSVTEFMSQGGTMIVPGHGWISDAADVGYYRDMLMVIRDRIQAMIDKGMTLAQVKAAKPTMDFDPGIWQGTGSDVALRRGGVPQPQGEEEMEKKCTRRSRCRARRRDAVERADSRASLLWRHLRREQDHHDQGKDGAGDAARPAFVPLRRSAGSRRVRETVGDRRRDGRPVRAAGRSTRTRSRSEIRSKWSSIRRAVPTARTVV